MKLMPIFVLTTFDQCKRVLCHTPLEYRRHGNKLYVICSDGAEWYHHLSDSPQATATINGRSYRVQVRGVLNGAEAQLANHLFRSNQSTKECAVVRFDLCEEPTVLLGFPSDRKWILPTLLSFGFVLNAALEWAGDNKRQREDIQSDV
jgi:hypothetical protein